MDVEEVGYAKNGGRSFRNPEGQHQLPYGFRAKPKGNPAAPYTVLLVIEDNPDESDGVLLTILPLKKEGRAE